MNGSAWPAASYPYMVPPYTGAIGSATPPDPSSKEPWLFPGSVVTVRERYPVAWVVLGLTGVALGAWILSQRGQ